MKISFIFFLTISTIFSTQAQKPNTSILMDCPEADKIAKVIFFRPFKLIGRAVGFDLYLKDTLQTKMKSKSFFVMELSEGKHRFTSVTSTLDVVKKNKNTLDLNIEAGKIYFVKCSVKSYSEGITKPNFKLLFKVLNKEEIKRSLQQKFLRKRIQEKLYNDFYNQST